MMDRRTFFKDLLLGTAGVVIAPKLFDQIVEAPYKKPPSEIFVYEEGFWLFREDKLVAYSSKSGVTLEMYNNPIDVSSNAEIMFIQGKSEAFYTIDDLKVIDLSIMDMTGETFLAVMRHEDRVYNSDVLFTRYSSSIFLRPFEKLVVSAEFRCTGETYVNIS